MRIRVIVAACPDFICSSYSASVLSASFSLCLLVSASRTSRLYPKLRARLPPESSIRRRTLTRARRVDCGCLRSRIYSFDFEVVSQLSEKIRAASYNVSYRVVLTSANNLVNIVRSKTSRELDKKMRFHS